MLNNGIQLIVSEYHILWEAVSSYEAQLETLSAMTADENQRLSNDERLQDIKGIKKSLQIAAIRDYGLKLN